MLKSIKKKTEDLKKKEKKIVEKNVTTKLQQSLGKYKYIMEVLVIET